MKLTTTLWHLCRTVPYDGILERLHKAYPNLGEDDEIVLYNMLTNGVNTINDVLWALRATVQQSRSVSAEFARRCALRAADYAHHSELAAAASKSAYDDAEWAMSQGWAAQRAEYAASAAFDASAVQPLDELNKQRSDLFELLGE